MSAVGLLSAPLLGGLIVEALGYEAAFIAALAMMLGALAVSLRFIDHAAAAAKSAPAATIRRSSLTRARARSGRTSAPDSPLAASGL